MNPFHVGDMTSGKEAKPRRQYTNLGMPIERVFQAAVKENYMKPLEARPPPSPLPRNFRANEYCDYHQGTGHKTENCWTLKNRIQDLVDNGTIIPVNHPNVNSNPLPNHGVNAVITKQDEFDPFKLFLEMNDICVLDLNDIAEEVAAITRDEDNSSHQGNLHQGRSKTKGPKNHTAKSL